MDVSGQLHVPAALPTAKGPNMGLCELQIGSGRCGEEESLLLRVVMQIWQGKLLQLQFQLNGHISTY
jgi:hypothetical protein